MSHSTGTRGGSSGSGRTRCDDLDPLLAPYVDNEAPPQDRSTVDTHLSACPPCRDRVAGERAAKTVLHARRDTLRACASEELRSRCQAMGHAARARSGGRTSTRRWVPLSIAATLVLAVAGVFLFGLTDRVDVFAAQLALDHVMCFKLTPDRIATGDPAALGRDWTSKQGWALQVPSSAPAQHLELIGLRRCGSTEGRVAHVMYRWRGEPLSLYVLPASLASSQAVQNVVDTFGHEAVVWSKDGRTYAVVARGAPAELAQVAAYVRTKAY
jgi:anti-sigma factor RsiW